ncbi:TonB-dependent receptor [Pseudopedobacter beijingensis]|uniref:Carboxypeptidase-like regulatory domain-containing protein n=1 Tax=Pseudopedobacter beijingensis TaxID=1207056 RepID=A0ABW4IFV1_9SPHI
MVRVLALFFLLFTLNSHAQSLSELIGNVKNEKGESLTGVSIYIANSKYRTQSNELGNYKLKVPIGNQKISFSYPGYQTIVLDIHIVEHKSTTQDLSFKVYHLEEIKVTDQRDRTEGIYQLHTKDFLLNPNASQSLESMLKQLPGVSTNNELSSQYSVRGGNFDENLIYINDVEIFKPYLIRNGQQEGLSLINPDLAGNVKFSAGGFTPKYGDKMSSVLDVKYQFKDSLSTIASLGSNAVSLSSSIPLGKANIAFGYRNKKNQSLLKTQQVSGSYNPSFHDFQLFGDYKFNKKFSIEALAIYNKSDFGLIPESRETVFGTTQEVLRLKVDYEGQEKDSYENIVGALTLNYKPKQNLYFKWINSVFSIKENERFDIYGQYIFEELDGDYLNGSFGKVKGNRGFGAYQDYGRNQLNSQIYASEVKLNYIRNRSQWEAGLKYQYDNLKDKLNEFNLLDSAGYSIPHQPQNNNLELLDYRFADNSLVTNRFSGYLMNSAALSSLFSYSAGVRFNYNSFTKEFIPSPRFVLTYKPDTHKDILYRFASGLYVQSPFYREMRNLDGTINFDVKSQKSVHFVASSDYKFYGLGTDLRFSTELYYKVLKDLVPYDIDNIRIRYLADRRSNGYAAGLDMSLSGEFVKDLQSSFRLSIIKTEEQLEGTSEYIRRPTDQRVNFSAFFQDRLFNSPTYKVHMNFLLGSKLPTWAPGTEKSKTNFTIPAYKRVDIGFSKDFLDAESAHRPKILDTYFKNLIVYAEVFNLLNINNTVSYLWITDVNNNRYAIPNFLTSRQLNFKIIAKF